MIDLKKKRFPTRAGAISGERKQDEIVLEPRPKWGRIMRFASAQARRKYCLLVFYLIG